MTNCQPEGQSANSNEINEIHENRKSVKIQSTFAAESQELYEREAPPVGRFLWDGHPLSAAL